MELQRFRPQIEMLEDRDAPSGCAAFGQAFAAAAQASGQALGQGIAVIATSAPQFGLDQVLPAQEFFC